MIQLMFFVYRSYNFFYKRKNIWTILSFEQFETTPPFFLPIRD